MCVFPKRSAHALPKCYHWLMSDSKSSIIDFYPTNFRLDVNGAAYAWMGVNLLPFIDQDRLFKAMKAADKDQKKLTVQERQRNKRTGDIYLYFVQNEKKSALRRQVLAQGQVYDATFGKKDEIVGKVIGNPSGLAKIGESIMTNDHGKRAISVDSNCVIMTQYLHPEYAKHDCSILKGAVLPQREVEDFEIFHIDRRFFNGENAIQMVADLLGIDTKKHTVYKTTAGITKKPEAAAVLGKR